MLVELVKVFMKRLKTILKSNIVLISFLLVLLLSYMYCNYIPRKSLFNENEKCTEGYIKKIDIDGNQLKILLKSKEKIIVNYYFFSLDEKNSFNLKINDFIEVYGSMSKPNNNTVFNTFNYKEYLYNKGINYIFKSNKIVLVKKNNNILYKIKNNIIDRIDNYKYSKEYLKIFLLGDKSELSNEKYNMYKNNGLLSILSLSGIHISLIILFINKIINNKKISNIIIIIFLLLYLFITDFQISLLRAALNYIGLLINKKFRLNISRINVLLIVLIMLLIINPFNLYNLGFQLSSIVTFFIIRFNNLYIDSNTIKKSLFISLTAFFSSLPILINTSYSINFMSIIVNFILTPIISLLLFPLSIIAFIFPFLDKLLYLLFEIVNIICKFFDSIELFKLSFSKIPLIFIIIYYLLLFCKKKKSILIIIIIFYLYNYYLIYPRIYYIDVGQGDSILIRINNKNILIDTGGKIAKVYEKWKEKKRKYQLIDNSISLFKSIGVKKIDYLITTHGDYDHMGEAINLVNNFKVEKLIFNCGPYNDLEKELIKVLDNKKIKYYSCIKELNIDKNKLYFLQTKEYDNENDNSNVIYIELNGYKFMFMGDASITTEKEILDKYNLLNIDVLKVGHHGSKTSSGKEFTNEINPRYSIISVGKNNKYGHPNKEVLDNLGNSKIYRTDEDGSVMFKIKNNKLKVETCNS